MPRTDKRFALLRGTEAWYPVLIGGPTSPTTPTFRISGKGTKDRFGQATPTTDLEAAVRAVLRDGLSLRFAPEAGPANTLSLRSKGVTGWRLDAAVAARLGLPTTGTAT